MTDIPDSVTAMADEPQAPTAPLDDFLAAYSADDNWWWRVPCGHHMNLFDAAIERIEELEDPADPTYHPPGSPIEVALSIVSAPDGRQAICVQFPDGFILLPRPEQAELLAAHLVEIAQELRAKRHGTPRRADDD
jgi:hypothetical protein